jgi:hypothetical protein
MRQSQTGGGERLPPLRHRHPRQSDALSWTLTIVTALGAVIWYFAIVGGWHAINALAGVAPFLEACR